MPRVAHLVPALFNNDDGIIGGAERYAFELARHMAERCQTTLLTFGRREREEQAGPLRVRVIGGTHYVRGQQSNPFAFGLLNELRKIDVVHCHQHHIVASSVAAIAMRLQSKRVFATDLGGGGWDISGYISTDHWYNGHLHISEFSRQLNGHANNAAAHVILGGVDTMKFSPDRSVVRDDSVLFVGRLLPHKGIDNLIEAMPPNVRLEVIGRPYDKEYLAVLHELAREKNVVWRHSCNDEELVAAYRRAACVVLPSVYRMRSGLTTRNPELLGQTLLEGMACGTAVICTDVASMPEIVEHERCGLIVPPNNVGALTGAIRALTSNADLALAMGTAGRARVIRHFTWPVVVDRCLDAYQGLSGPSRH